jgi:hypothetical protein
MEPYDLLLSSQEPAAGSCSELNNSGPKRQTVSLRLSFSVLAFLEERKKTYEITMLYVCVCVHPIRLLKRLTAFHEIWNGNYAIGGHSNTVIPVSGNE